MSTIADGDDLRVVAGVDTHKDVHVAVVLDELGRLLDTASFPFQGAARTAHPPRRAPQSVPAPEPKIAPPGLLDLTDSIEAHVAFTA